jgi:hypothetical protein
MCRREVRIVLKLLKKFEKQYSSLQNKLPQKKSLHNK